MHKFSVSGGFLVEQEEDEEDMIEPLLQKCRDIESNTFLASDISLLAARIYKDPSSSQILSNDWSKWLYVCVGEFHALLHERSKTHRYSLYLHNVSGILADQMGLGKTVRNIDLCFALVYLCSRISIILFSRENVTIYQMLGVSLTKSRLFE